MRFFKRETLLQSFPSLNSVSNPNFKLLSLLFFFSNGALSQMMVDGMKTNLVARWEKYGEQWKFNGVMQTVLGLMIHW